MNYPIKEFSCSELDVFRNVINGKQKNYILLASNYVAVLIFSKEKQNNKLASEKYLQNTSVYSLVIKLNNYNILNISPKAMRNGKRF